MTLVCRHEPFSGTAAVLFLWYLVYLLESFWWWVCGWELNVELVDMVIISLWEDGKTQVKRPRRWRVQH